MKILDLDLDLTFEITRDFGLNNFDHRRIEFPCQARSGSRCLNTGRNPVYYAAGNQLLAGESCWKQMEIPVSFN